MAEFETKLKLGRKLEGVDPRTASNNQVSALFRVTGAGEEAHVSMSVESDAMTAEDVAAVFQVLHERGVLPAGSTKTWLSQPESSEQRFGKTTLWKGADLKLVLEAIRAGSAARAAPPGSAEEATARLREARLKIAELQKQVEALRATLEA